MRTDIQFGDPISTSPVVQTIRTGMIARWRTTATALNQHFPLRDGLAPSCEDLASNCRGDEQVEARGTGEDP